MVLMFLATPLLAQPAGRGGPQRAPVAESAVKQAAQQLAGEKRVFERDLEVMNHLRIADDALADNMQPSAALAKAFEHVEKARGLGADLLVMEGLIRIHRELESAKRSPATADFGRLRSVLRDDGLRPASRVVVRNALRLEEEVLAWIKVQELVSAHLRSLSEIAGDSLRASAR